MPVAPAPTMPLSAACIRARRGRERLMHAIYSGHIAATKVDGVWAVDAASLDAFLERESAKTARPASLRDAFEAATATA